MVATSFMLMWANDLRFTNFTWSTHRQPHPTRNHNTGYSRHGAWWGWFVLSWWQRGSRWGWRM